MTLQEIQSRIVPHTCATVSLPNGGHVQVKDPVAERNWNNVRQMLNAAGDNFDQLAPVINAFNILNGGNGGVNGPIVALVPVILNENVKSAGAPAGPIKAAEWDFTQQQAGPPVQVYNRMRVFDDRLQGNKGWAAVAGDILELVWIEPRGIRFWMGHGTSSEPSVATDLTLAEDKKSHATDFTLDTAKCKVLVAGTYEVVAYVANAASSTLANSQAVRVDYSGTEVGPSVTIDAADQFSAKTLVWILDVAANGTLTCKSTPADINSPSGSLDLYMSVKQLK